MKIVAFGVKFLLASVMVGYAFFLYREGYLTTDDENDPAKEPGKMLGLFGDKPGFGAYEIALGAVAVTGLAVAGMGMKMLPRGLKKMAPASPLAAAA